MILKSDENIIKCRACEFRFKCLTGEQDRVKCKKTGKWVDLIEFGGMKLDGVDI